MLRRRCETFAYEFRGPREVPVDELNSLVGITSKRGIQHQLVLVLPRLLPLDARYAREMPVAVRGVEQLLAEVFQPPRPAR